MKTQKFQFPNNHRKWFQIDASKNSMGRVATEIANILRESIRDFTPHMDMGDYVVAINAHKLKFTGRKVSQKLYTAIQVIWAE